MLRDWREMKMRVIVALSSSRLETRLRYLTYASSQYPHDYEWERFPAFAAFEAERQ